jgi:AcrR family transcriptional regulator
MTFSTTRAGSDQADHAAEPTDDRPDRLIAAARDLANETRSAAFTVNQVTMRAGLSLKSFYRCFASKDELLLALLAADSKIGANFLAERVGDRTGAEAVRAYVTELFDMLTLPGAVGYAGVLVREYLRLTEHNEDALRAALAPLLDLLAKNLDTKQPQRDALTMFGVLLGGIHGIVMGSTPAQDTREVGEYLHRFCTQGVGR